MKRKSNRVIVFNEDLANGVKTKIQEGFEVVYTNTFFSIKNSQLTILSLGFSDIEKILRNSHTRYWHNSSRKIL